MHSADDDWAVFWCSLLGPILLEEVQPGERRRFLKELSRKEVLLPGGKRKRISLSTLRRKVRQFRQQKIAGLRRQPRKDHGQARKDRGAMIARAIALKKQQPYRSPDAINEFLKKEFGRTIPKSTLNRHLRSRGATRRKLGVSEEKIRCRSRARSQQCPLGGRLRGRSPRLSVGPGHQEPLVDLDRLP